MVRAPQHHHNLAMFRYKPCRNRSENLVHTCTAFYGKLLMEKLDWMQATRPSQCQAINSPANRFVEASHLFVAGWLAGWRAAPGCPHRLAGGKPSLKSKCSGGDVFTGQLGDEAKMAPGSAGRLEFPGLHLWKKESGRPA